VGIRGNDSADRLARQGANLPDVSHDIGLSLSEALGKLHSKCVSNWENNFKETANKKGWADPNKLGNGDFPNMPRYLLPLFFRIRTKALKTDYVPQACACGETFRFDHIFTCRSVKSMLPKTTALLNNTVNISHKIVSFDKEKKWTVARTFLNELFRSPVGHLI
jgi:hypothetical protein